MNTDYNSEDDAPMLAKQRQSLDMMSAQLTHNLNIMIAEQEQRVREFAAQHPQTPLPPTAAQPEEELPRRKAPQRPVPPAYEARTPAPKPEPAPAPRQQQVHRNVQRYSKPVSPNAVKKEKKKELSAGNIIFAIVVIIFLLRACS